MILFCTCLSLSFFVITQNSCPCLFETNILCTCLGSLGCYDGNDRPGRESVMRIAFSANLCAFILTAFSLISMYPDIYKIIEISALNTGTMEAVLAKEEIADRLSKATFSSIFIETGWRGIAIDNPNTFGKQTILYDQFCELTVNNKGMERYADPFECNRCSDVVDSLVLLLIVGAGMYLPSFGLDWLRLYKNYDLNCARFMTFVFDLLAIAGSVLAYLLYDTECYQPTFYQNEIAFDIEGNVVQRTEDDANTALVMEVDWKIGNGLIILWSGAGVKLIHMFCHCCIPTPTMTRNLDEQNQYEDLGRPEEGLIDVMADEADEHDEPDEPSSSSESSSSSSSSS